MKKNFTWERGPFSQCPSCKLETFGFLAGGGNAMTMRCTVCRYSHSEVLPKLNKKLIYLDQFAFCALFQIESKGRPLGKHQAFWADAHARLRRIVLLQQAVLPHSDVHHSETVVSPFATALRECYEHLGGDARLEDTGAVQQAQVLEYAHAYLEGREPTITLDADNVIKRDRNRWLDDIRISVNVDYSSFADGHWADVERTSAAIDLLIANWVEEKPSFEEVLEREQAAFGSSRRAALVDCARRVENAIAAGDIMAALNASQHWVSIEFEMLRHVFRNAGVAEKDLTERIIEFWEWPRNREQPSAHIFSYLFAALARKVVSGQRKVTSGFMNDVRAISTYAPFVDAMFLDNECASLLSEAPLRDELKYRACIFSLNTQDEFLAYLAEIEAATPGEVLDYAARIYGIN